MPRVTRNRLRWCIGDTVKLHTAKQGFVDALSTPAAIEPMTEAQAVSADRKAWYLPVGVTGTLGDPTAAESLMDLEML